MIAESIHLYIETVIINLSTATEILNRHGQITHLMLIERARLYKTYGGQPICWANTFFPAKKRKPLGLQIFGRIGKTMQKLQ